MNFCEQFEEILRENLSRDVTRIGDPNQLSRRSIRSDEFEKLYGKNSARGLAKRNHRVRRIMFFIVDVDGVYVRQRRFLVGKG